MNIEKGLLKLNELLPLLERQSKLTPKSLIAHRTILNTFSKTGLAAKNIKQSILLELNENDLIVLDKEGCLVGAYPFSLRETKHHVVNDDLKIYAMCAFDAVAIAPVFNIKTTILSQCHVSNSKIEISQNGSKLETTFPNDDIHIGIRWQSAGSCAADNLCMEMVFLKNKEIAIEWGQDDSFSIFTLDDAIEFSIKYFKPLMEQ